MAGDCSKVKILFSLKQWKVVDIVFTQNSFCDQDKTLPELKLRYHPETKIWRQFSPLTMGRYLKLNSLYGVCCFYKRYSVRRLTTTNILRLWYLMSFVVILLRLKFNSYNSIWSIVFHYFLPAVSGHPINRDYCFNWIPKRILNRSCY